MSGSGLFGILMLVLSAGSVNATDWMTMVQPIEYFKSRNIDPTMDRLIDFAIADIDSAKAQIRQLAALQQFTNEAEKFKLAKNYDTNRTAIEEVAEGKHGKDPHYSSWTARRSSCTCPCTTAFQLTPKW
jgi:hypothetical protein